MTRLLARAWSRLAGRRCPLCYEYHANLYLHIHVSHAGDLL